HVCSHDAWPNAYPHYLRCARRDRDAALERMSVAFRPVPVGSLTGREAVVRFVRSAVFVAFTVVPLPWRLAAQVAVATWLNIPGRRPAVRARATLLLVACALFLATLLASRPCGRLM